MQSKVSMVMPCYNKVEYVKEMFDSIIAQKWDNIELILVNDGSTDGTREVISEYVPKFLARGFEAVVVDQENAGVCAAAKAGLLRVTGEYVCMVDADDELDPEYVSTMAEWLDTHSDCDFCVCDAVLYRGEGENKKFMPFNPRGPADQDPMHLERYLLIDIRTEVWVYMARTDYLKKCGIPETYFTTTSGTHEPGFAIPLLAHGGKFKYFSIPLYRFNQSGFGHSRPPELARKLQFAREYCRLCEIAVDTLPETIASPERKALLKSQANLTKHMLMVNYTESFSDSRQPVTQDFLCCINAMFTPSPQLSNIRYEDFFYLTIAVKNNILGITPVKIPQRTAGRVIAWGTQGKRGRTLLPALYGTPLEPLELWDMAGDGATVKKPAPGSLCANDLVLVLPAKGVSEKICAELDRTSCERMLSSDILEYLAYFKYPQFYDGSLKFNPKGE